MQPSSGPDENEGRAPTGPTLDDRPGFGGVSETDRRAQVVSLVAARPERPYTVGELAARMQTWFEERNDGMTPTEEEIHGTLYDFDLPALEREGKLVFERSTGRVYAPEARTQPATGTTGSATSDDEPTGPSALGSALLVGAAGLGVGAAAAGLGPLQPSHAVVPAGALAAVVVLRWLRS
jgi:hypothetical protein